MLELWQGDRFIIGLLLVVRRANDMGAMMKKTPILFSGPMVRAILTDSKTQTRRVVKPQPIESTYKGVTPMFQWKDCINTLRPLWPDVMNSYCPYGRPGDRLWVRETWNCIDTGRLTQRQDWVRYRATDGDELHWRPSIHMPRWASRITLEVVSIKVERVQDITEEDAKAEGMGGGTLLNIGPRERFAALWDGINFDRGYPWSLNPWVWVVEFRRRV